MILEESTPAEEKVLAAFRAGDPDVDVADAEIRGDFLRGLFLGDYEKKADYRGTCITNAIISNTLDMEFCETKFPVRFHNCSFVRGIQLQQLICPELDFRGCTLKGGFDARLVKVAGCVDMRKVDAAVVVVFDGAEIRGQLNCMGGSFHSQNENKIALIAQNIKITGDLFLSNGFNAIGEVSLLGAEIGGQLVCSGGIFQNEGWIALNAEGIQVTGGALLREEFGAVGEVRLLGAAIGKLECTGGSIHNCGKIALNAGGIRVTSGVFLRNGFRAIGAVSLLGAEIGGQLNCVGGSFQNDGKVALNARCIKVATNVALRGKFNGEVSFAGAEIGGQLDCVGGNFRNKKGDALNAQGIRVAADVFLRDGFNAVGEVSLLGADIRGQLDCTGGSFQNEGKTSLNAQSIKVASDVFLSVDNPDSEHTKGFKAGGKVDLAGAEIGGQLNCVGGIFQNKEGIAINAQDIKVATGIFMGKGFKAEGAVNLLGAEIHGQLDCAGGSFQNKGGATLIAQGIKVASDVFLVPHVTEGKDVWENFSASGWVLFTNATVGGNILLNGCKLTHLSLAGANVFGEFRDDANIYKDHNGNDIVLDIDGFRYHRLDVTKERVKDRLAWVGLMSKGDDFYPQTYEQLMQVYREMGHMNWARKVGFALEERRRKGMESGWWKKWYWLLRHTIGYGYKPFRSVTHWFIPLILAGFVLFSGMLPCPDSQRAGGWLCHCMAPSDAGVLLSDDWKIHGKLPKDYPDFNPVYYAVEAALPVLPLGQTENWHPKTWWAKWLQGAITIIGALVLTILASYGVGVLGPRWKDG